MEIAIMALSIISISLLISLIVITKKLKGVSKGFYSLFMSYTALIDASNNLGNININDVQDIHKENFIKFLSDSREWAYEYIDKVQIQLKDFIEKADKEFAFFDKYGMLSEGEIHYETMKTISEEYKKLKVLLPEETNDRR